MEYFHVRDSVLGCATCGAEKYGNSFPVRGDFYNGPRVTRSQALLGWEMVHYGLGGILVKILRNLRVTSTKIG